MTKAEIIERLVDLGVQRSTAMKVVDQTFRIMAESLSSGESLFIRGLGTFRVREVAERMGRNISANVPTVIPAHKTVKFIPGKIIKNALK